MEAFSHYLHFQKQKTVHSEHWGGALKNQSSALLICIYYLGINGMTQTKSIGKAESRML